MKICAISDTHTLHRKLTIPECDVLIHSGDITDRGETKTIWDFLEWLKDVPAKKKIFISGNHDFCFQKQREMISITDPSIIYLEHTSVEINGLTFFGTPWTPYFYDWAFNGTDSEDGDSYGPNLNRLFSHIPDYTDILISHGPPNGILDKNERGYLTGSKMLLRHLARIQPKVCIFGHIHESYGKDKIEWTSGKVTQCFNASSLKRDYITTNPVTVIEV